MKTIPAPAAPAIITRADYMEKRATHREYYGQFVTPAIKALVLARFKVDQLRRAMKEEENLNSIPLSHWDGIANYPTTRLCHAQLKAAGDGSTMATGVCILKEAARQIVEDAILGNYFHEASGVTLCKELAQPHLTTFAEVFTDSAPHIHQGQSPFQSRFIEEGKERMEISSYCSRRGQDGHIASLNVRPAECIYSRIKESMLLIDHDTIYFEVIDHGNGWSLVTCHHNAILGSRWLAYIRTETIPTTPEK